MSTGQHREGRTGNHRYGEHPRDHRVCAYGFSTDDTADPVLREMRHVVPTYRRLTAGPFRCTLAGVGRHGMHYELETLEGELWGEIRNPDDYVVFVLPREPGSTKALGAPLLEMAYAVGPGAEFAGATAGVTFSGVDFHGETLERIAASAGVDVRGSRWLQPTVTPLAADASGGFAALLDELAQVIAADPLKLADPVLFTQLEQDFAGLLRAILATDAPDSTLALSASARTRLAYRGKDLLLELARGSVDRASIGDLCLALGTTERTLQHAFQHEFGVGFREMDRAFRLQAAHEALRSPDAPSSVTEVATRFGFWHLGRFSADYRAMFGRLPSESARRANEPADR